MTGVSWFSRSSFALNAFAKGRDPYGLGVAAPSSLKTGCLGFPNQRNDTLRNGDLLHLLPGYEDSCTVVTASWTCKDAVHESKVIALFSSHPRMWAGLFQVEGTRRVQYFLPKSKMEESHFGVCLILESASARVPAR